MSRILASTAFVVALLPKTAFAYRVPENDHWRNFMVTLINESRGEFGLQPVGLDEELTDISQAHAEDSALHFDDTDNASRRSSYLIHTSSDGGGLGDRIRSYGLTGYMTAGENVGFRYRAPFPPIHETIGESIRLIHEGMMAEVPPDDGHRRTILGDYTHVGVGLELHRHADEQANTLLLVTDFANFTDGRLKRVPENAGKGPRRTVNTLAQMNKVSKEEQEPPKRQRRRRERERNIDIRRRRVITDIAIPGQAPAPRERAAGRGVAVRGGMSWSKRHRARLERRRSDRLERLPERVEVRRIRRLRQRAASSAG